MKKLTFLLLAACTLAACDPQPKKTTEEAVAPLPALKISDNGRYFMTEDGKPFFWLGDTSWLLFKNVNREDAELFLENRRQKGFNVIQIMVLHTLAIQNAYGQKALIDNDVTQPNITEGSDPADSLQYDYWDHADYIIKLAESKGIYAALVPVWGSNIRNVTPDQATIYGKWIAGRYKDYSNIIWLNGGDINGADSTATWHALGEAIRSVDTTHLMTFHPRGRTSSTDWFHNAPWLDFNMFQSGHRTYAQGVSNTTSGQKEYGEDNWRYMEEDWGKTPAKPSLDGEPSYENIPHGLGGRRSEGEVPRWKAPDVRRYAYWSVFAGGAGFTYGENSIMQMLTPGDPDANYTATLDWRQAQDAEGAGQMHFVKELILAQPSYFDRVPDQSLVAGENGERYERVIATRGADFALFYTYTGRPFAVNMGKIAGENVKAQWYSPRDGSYTPLGEMANSGTAEFDPPGEIADGNDWVLELRSITN
jgi:hypothetical protein